MYVILKFKNSRCDIRIVEGNTLVKFREISHVIFEKENKTELKFE